MRIIIYCLLAILWPATKSYAQSPPSNISPLSIGDTVPDIEFDNVMNYPVSKIHLSDFKDRLLIIDFWSSWCGNCISLFTHMDSLQKKFGNRIQIILFNTLSEIAHDDNLKIRKIISRLEKRTGQQISLPIVYNSKKLDLYFPSRYLPHEVWINGEGIVTGITSALEVTEQNIAAILDNRRIRLHFKHDILDYDASKPLFVNDNGGAVDDLVYRSLLTRYREGLCCTTIRYSDLHPDKRIGMSFLNVSLPFLLANAYAGTGKYEFPNNRTILDVKDIDQFKPHDDSSYYQYTYCYDILVPPATHSEISRYFQEDIRRFFHITVSVRNKKMDCYILRRNSGARLSLSGPGAPDLDTEDGSIRKYLHNCSLLEVVRFFDLRLDLPLIDESELPPDTFLDIDLPQNLKDQKGLVQSLKNAGFSLIKETRNMDVSIVSDKE